MKKIVICLIVILMTVALIYFIAIRPKNDEKNNVNTNSTTQNVNENKNVINNTVNNTVNNVIENKVQENVNVNVNEVVQTNTETFDESPEAEQEKAISIVKKDWGSTNSNIKFSNDGMDENGNYIITVRDSSTTEALAFYTVNVKNNTFNKKEVN